MSPIIRTARLVLCPFADQHLTERYVGWLNDRETTQYSEQRHTRHTIETCRAYRESLTAAGHLFWAIERGDGDPPHIGNITAYVDHANRLADVAIMLGEKTARGSGYGLEAFAAVCDWLLSAGKFRKVTAGTLSSNAPMLAIMRRVRMRQDGVRRRHYIIGDTEVDLVYGALFAHASPPLPTNSYLAG